MTSDVLAERDLQRLVQTDMAAFVGAFSNRLRSERTMAISRPYLDITSPYKGNVTETGDLNAWVERVHRAGIQVNCHAKGMSPSTWC